MSTTDGIEDRMTKPETRSALTRALPFAVLLVGAVAAIVFARDYLTFDAFAANYEALIAWRDANGVLSVIVMMAVYVLTVAFSIPGATILTLVTGFLWGTVTGSIMVVLAATVGATLVFLAARTALHDVLKARAGKWLERMEGGFAENSVSYLLIMRLVPAVPFFVANIAPAFLGARTVTFIWTTFVGIIPGTVVYISVGAGLGTELQSGEVPDLGVIFEWHVLGPLLGLAALAALPAILKAVRGARS